jgi:predicted anti-sigma-YlaC factor YlaD
VKKKDRLTCEETFRRLDDYLDRELNHHEMALVRKHLKACDVCESAYGKSYARCRYQTASGIGSSLD